MKKKTEEKEKRPEKETVKKEERPVWCTQCGEMIVKGDRYFHAVAKDSVCFCICDSCLGHALSKYPEGEKEVKDFIIEVKEHVEQGDEKRVAKLKYQVSVSFLISNFWYSFVNGREVHDKRKQA